MIDDESRTEVAIETPMAKLRRASAAPRAIALEATGPVLRRLQHYVLLERIGAGGMGVVYAALDERLERKVAIKVVAGDRGHTPDEEQRFLREAQAQARLTHPNVVTVYEVGSLPGGGLFLAMELVKGDTLRAWQSTKPAPSWQDLVTRYAAAGEGLAAAHRVGIIHRDFKPDNILVGDDGRVRVADFGLAFAARPADAAGATVRDPDIPDPGAIGDAPALAQAPALTAHGSLAGTPGYVAPELFTGGSADARADQFGFCVALYEALHGERPYADFAFISDAPEPRRTEPGPGYPRWLWDVLARGLALAPEARFPSMDALVAELTRSRGRGRRRIAIAAAGAVVLATTAAVALPHDAPPCPVDTTALAGVWDLPTRARVQAALLGTGEPFAANVWASTAIAFDRYARRWVDARQAACEATHVHHTQSAALLDRRMACLAGRRRSLAAATEALQDRPGRSVSHAGEILASLGDLEPCADTARLSADPGLASSATWPLSAHVQAEVDAVRARLARAETLLVTGDIADAEPVIAEAARLAEAVDDAPVRAEVAYYQARLHLVHGDLAASLALADRAVELAVASHHDELPADVWVRLALSAGGLSQRPTEIEAWIGQGEAWIRRLGHAADSRQIDLEHARALLQLTAGDTRGAKATLTRALATAEQLWRKDDPRLIPLLRYRATIEGQLHEAKLAVADAERALALGIAAWGPDYPDLASTRRLIGLLDIEQLGEFERGERELTLALQSYRAQLGDDSVDAASCEQALSQAGMYRGDYEAALQHAERADQIYARRLGPDNPRRGEALIGVAALRYMRGDFAGSLEADETAYAILRAAHGPNHARVGIVLSNTGETLLALKQYERALRDFAQALAVLERSFGPTHSYVAGPLKGLGLAYLALGQPRAAVAPLERALGLMTQPSTGADPHELAEVRWALAQALQSVGRDPPRARALAEQALAAYRGLGRESAGRVTEVTRWLASARSP